MRRFRSAKTRAANIGSPGHLLRRSGNETADAVGTEHVERVREIFRGHACR